MALTVDSWQNGKYVPEPRTHIKSLLTRARSLFREILA